MKKIYVSLLALAILISALFVSADQTQIPNYGSARDIFWEQVYPNGNWTLYCGFRFNDRHGAVNGMNLSIEHVYSRAWMRDYLDCGNDSACRANSERYNHMAADLHNMYAAIANINSSRGDAPYGMIDGENWRYDFCDYERATGIAEPRPIARGNIARSIFYMHSEYGLPIESTMLEVLKQWNRDDPPSCHEMRRNNRIEELQGTRNQFIDHPGQAEDF